MINFLSLVIRGEQGIPRFLIKYMSNASHKPQPYKYILGLVITGALFLSNLHNTTAQPNLKVDFSNVTNEKIQQCFIEVWQHYKHLHQYQITLVQKPIEDATMQAQPAFSLKGLINGVKHYEIQLSKYVRDSENILVSDLPHDVLTGWFAHELGHIMDYEPYSNVEMVLYGFKYVTSDAFKTKAEHTADYMAIAHGFKTEILAAKHYILDNQLVKEIYKAKIRKYYLPIKTVELYNEYDLSMSQLHEL